MPPEKSTESRWRLKPFSEYLKEAMSPETWAWYSKYRPKESASPSSESNDD